MNGITLVTVVTHESRYEEVNRLGMINTCSINPVDMMSNT